MDAFAYQYLIGGAVFTTGMWFAWRQGYVGLRGAGLRNLLVALGGLGFFMGLQGWLQFGEMTTAPEVPYDGSYAPKERLGTALDYGIMIGYFVLILLIGTWFGRGQKTTKDFFFGGQRFAWWLVAFSLIATTIGSYSFVKYSKVAFGYGLASSQTYLNDWFWLPLMLFGWLPILYFSRITSIPEYFERRFDARIRKLVTWMLLVYLVGYVGVNLFTMGKALNHLLGWDIWPAATMVASISAVYVTMGGQTSVIMTDLFQGVMLLATGAVILWLGADYLGGADLLWEHLPRGHRTAFTNFNEDASYSSVGIFWQDMMANSAMFFFLNQGLAMRFMATRSIREARRASISVMLFLMPVAAAVVASGGWVGKALQHAGVLPPDMDGGRVFFIAAELLAQPGVFGLIMAALTAALMSTVDTLITAVAAIVVNDVYTPKHPDADESKKLAVARYASVGVTLMGVALVPFFSMFDSIYAAHGAFTAAVTPPLVVALLYGVFWRRFTTTAAQWTIVGGTVAIAASIFFPALIQPVAHGVPAQLVQKTWNQIEGGDARVLVGSAGLGQEFVVRSIGDFAERAGRDTAEWPANTENAVAFESFVQGVSGERPLVVADLQGRTPQEREAVLKVAQGARAAQLPFALLVIDHSYEGPLAVGGGLFAGAKQYKYMRACFGLLVCALLGLIVTFFSKATPFEQIRGYVWGTVADAIRVYKGSDGVEGESAWVSAAVVSRESDELGGPAALPVVQVSAALSESLGGVKAGDLVYMTDSRWWLGGLRSCHGIVGAVQGEGAPSLSVGPSARVALVAPGRESASVRVQRLY
jgi:solute:Na+ symporter, SSS family